MRIACIHIPQFALQSATRVDPALRGAAVAVVSGVEPGREAAGVLHAPIVLACSRLAWAQGVRLGMTAAAARSQSPAIQIVTADASHERETVRAIADALLGVSATVDTGGRVGAGGAHLALYAEVPAKTRGAAFGERLLEVLDELGVAARVGIADDRFTAWVAAAHGGIEETDEDGKRAARTAQASRLADPSHVRATSVVAVPRGGSAAFLAPRPLSLLAISPEVQHMLEALGVRTLGEFAALPAPSIARPLDADYRALARGESDVMLRPYVPDAPIREEVTVSASNVLDLQDLLPAGAHAEGLSIGAAIALLARRIELRLLGRSRAAARLDITALGRGDTRDVPVTLESALADAESLAHVIAAAVEAITADDSSSSSSPGGASAHRDGTSSPVGATAHRDGTSPGGSSAHDEWRLRVVVAGEQILTGEITEIFAEGTAPYARIEPSSIYAAPGDAHASSPYAVSPAPTGTAAHESPPAARGTPHVREHDARRRSSDHPLAEAIDPLAVVLSSSGSLFALSPPTLRAERRDAHRRTRRGKQRRSRPTPQAQPRLFDRTSSKS